MRSEETSLMIDPFIFQKETLFVSVVAVVVVVS